MRPPHQSLQVTRIIAATPERVFAAWTDPKELRQWWGPREVECRSATIDLRVEGMYEIENVLPNGASLWIRGEFELVDAPRKLVYSWTVGDREKNSDSPSERVTVVFNEHPDGTELSITHQQIPSLELRNQHENGWLGCLDGLRNYLS